MDNNEVLDLFPNRQDIPDLLARNTLRERWKSSEAATVDLDPGDIMNIKLLLWNISVKALKAFMKEGCGDVLELDDETLENIELERVSTPHHEQTRKMLQVCKAYTGIELMHVCAFAKFACPECTDMRGWKSFKSYVVHFIQRLSLFRTNSKCETGQPCNFEYFFHLYMDDIFIGLDEDIPKLKPNPDFDIREKIKEMSILDIEYLLAGIDSCEILKKRSSHCKCIASLAEESENRRSSNERRYLLTVIKKELGIELNALDMVAIGEHYAKTDVTKAVEYSRKGYKWGLESHKNGDVLYMYQDQEVKIVRPFYWLTIKFGIVRNFVQAEALRECKELIYLLTKGEFKGLHVETQETFDVYNNILEEMVMSKHRDESTDVLYLIDIFTQEIRKLEKFIDVKKSVDFGSIMGVQRLKMMDTMWASHAWGQYGDALALVVPCLEKQTSIDTDRRSANIIVNMKYGKHFMNKHQQFIVESLDKALRIAKDGDVIFLNKGTYESSYRKKNGKTCYEFSKNLTVIGEAVNEVTMISSIVKYTNSTVTFKRLTISPSPQLKKPRNVYKAHENQDSCYILDGTAHFVNVKFPIDKDTCIFVVHTEGKERPVVTFKYCTVSSLIKELGQENQLPIFSTTNLNRRFLSFSGVMPKIMMDTCCVREISSVISVLDTDIPPKKIKNSTGDEVDIPNCAEIVIKDCLIFDCESVFYFDQISTASSGMKFLFKRNFVQWQSSAYEKRHKNEFTKINSKVPDGGNNYYAFSNKKTQGINITNAKEVVIIGNVMGSRNNNIKTAAIYRVEKFNFETNFVTNICDWAVNNTKCITVGNVKEGLFRNNKIFGFQIATEIVVGAEYSYLGIIDSEIQCCYRGIVVQKESKMKMSDTEMLESQTKLTISNIGFQIIFHCISITQVLCSVDISGCNFSSSCALPIELEPEIVEKKLAHIDNKYYAHDNDDVIEGTSSHEYLLQDIVPKLSAVLRDMCAKWKIKKGSLADRCLKDSFKDIVTDTQRKKYYTCIFLQLKAFAKRDTKPVDLVKLMQYYNIHDMAIDPLLFLELHFEVLGKQDEIKVNAANVVVEENLEDEVD